MDSKKGNAEKSSPENGAAPAAMTDGSVSTVHEGHPDDSDQDSVKEDGAKRPHAENEGTTKNKKRKRRKSPMATPRAHFPLTTSFFKDERVKWLEEKRDDKDFEGQNPFLGMSAAIGTRWKALSEEQKQKYEEAADKDRARYKKEMEEYSEKLIREAAEERLANADRQIRTNATPSQPSGDTFRQQPTEPPREPSVQATAPLPGADLVSQLQQLLQMPSAPSGGGNNANELVQLLPFLLSLHTPISQNLSVAELLEELQRVQYLTDMLLRNRLRVNHQTQAPEAQTFMSLLQLLGQRQQ